MVVIPNLMIGTPVEEEGEVVEILGTMGIGENLIRMVETINTQELTMWI